MIGAVIARPLLRDNAAKKQEEWEDVQPYVISGTFPYYKTLLQCSQLLAFGGGSQRVHAPQAGSLALLIAVVSMEAETLRTFCACFHLVWATITVNKC